MLYEIALYIIGLLIVILLLGIFSGILVTEMHPPFKKKFKYIWYMSSMIIGGIYTIIYFLF